MNDLAATFQAPRAAMRLTSAQIRATSQNIANVDTPNYRRVRVEFGDLLEAASQNDPAARSRQLEAFQPQIVEDRSAPTSHDGNSVSLENEIVSLHDITLRHQFAARRVSGKLSGLRLAIIGR